MCGCKPRLPPTVHMKQLAFEFDKRTDFDRHLEQCAAMVKTWPLWKQNMLGQIASPTVDPPRTKIKATHVPIDSR
jgi:hypothetical protein